MRSTHHLYRLSEADNRFFKKGVTPSGGDENR